MSKKRARAGTITVDVAELTKLIEDSVRDLVQHYTDARIAELQSELTATIEHMARVFDQHITDPNHE